MFHILYRDTFLACRIIILSGFCSGVTGRGVHKSLCNVDRVGVTNNLYEKFMKTL